MKRREFINWVGLGVLASSLPVAIAACQPTDPASDSTSEDAATSDTPREDGFAEIGTVAELDDAGVISDKTFQGEQVLVIRDPGNPETVLAVSSLCTHQGCSVEWRDSNQFFCPCHSSAFSPDGSVTAGPATEPLPVFEAKIESDVVLVKVAA
ncbi:MAG: ubiquinol-cytochrome c reductase iron-sulfur subunit [Elainellaceae cyanobacterium]